MWGEPIDQQLGMSGQLENGTRDLKLKIDLRDNGDTTTSISGS